MSTGPSEPTVRFESQVEEIEPEHSLDQVRTLTGHDGREELSPEARQELRSLAVNMQKTRLQNFNYEPVSLPVSRVPSESSQHQSARASPHHSPSISAVHTPPLTPAASDSRDVRAAAGADNKGPAPSVMTPQISPPHEAPPTSIPTTNISSNEQRPSAAAQARLPRSSGARSRSSFEGSAGVPTHPKQPPSHILPRGDSPATSQDPSPTSTPRPGTPSTPGGAHSPRPQTPTSVVPVDPYGAARALQNLEERIPRARGSDTRPRSMYGGPGSNGAGGLKPDNKRHTGLFSRHEDKSHHGSMSDLKRFFKFGGKKDRKHESRSRQSSPSRPPSSVVAPEAGAVTPPSARSSIALPFADDHGIEAKYGKFGKVLGSGAGGSVRLMKRASDGVTFAVKQFRDRHSYESEREYNKKVTAEFCIGSTLHHGNIIETMDIIQEKGKWYEVMEYAPYDLFAIVMTGKMTREEICCCTLQIISGVHYLHSMGLAHRDLKLDNVVVNEHGIMKIIDFGSAVVFRYPFENDIVLATGIVGSDPYLAPEVYELPKYDPRPTDIWSLAIIFCCMTLRRFPWKAPRVSDNSYKLFITEPSEEERRSGLYPQRPYSEPASRAQSGPNQGEPPRKEGSEAGKSEPEDKRASSSTASTQTSTPAQPQTIKGPWRLLRLLPRETRHIIGRMLEIDPKKRATLEEVLSDPWVYNNMHANRVCSQDPNGIIHRGEGHEHTLEPGGGGSAPPSKAK
ncbi:hypothetical protein, variant [Verruconis gallopava]|uniref:non-specific serine/threonine protein kinase n=1 Tax=Verruconis gallopava TaxID=253628 RepID=A0A0D2A608_9PEZI|nr:uncharacterized protein PV09_06802 [Verruconis gallopava]XP_016211835.1 hypothetical protein, variant [Verruconis gallopava]KIW01965.1 hypothetical protein PV09_06802 [Verruconis gallopava]KIW01966.1 hypothetical protein, variant [Verruconis gallopava]